MIDPTTIAAIVAEARDCFLQEDAPEYLTMLSEGTERLQIAYKNPSVATNLDNVYKDLARAAHSLKGGAGMAELISINQLAHKLEDLLEALEQSRVKDADTALQLIILASDEIQNLIDLAHTGTFESNSAQEINAALAEFLTLVPQNASDSLDLSLGNNNDFIKTALNVDLESCLQRVENSLKQSLICHPECNEGSPQIKNTKEDFPKSSNDHHIQQQLNILLQQSTLLGEALNFPQLVELVNLTQQINQLNTTSPVTLAQRAIAEIRQLRADFLAGKSPSISPAFLALLPQFPPQEKPATPKTEKPEISTPDNEIYVRVPLSKLETLSNTVGELLINYESLLLYENQFKQASLNIKKRFQQLNPLKEKVEYLYDQEIIKQDETSPIKGFDSLEFDRYSEVHTTLQQFQELMVQLQEIREDIDLVRQDYHETLVRFRGSIDVLDENLTQSRLVSFGTLANSFIKPIENLSKKHHKSAELVIEGENVWIDQSILEQLRTPLTHLIRNAFDHGIENPQIRINQKKNRTGTIKIAALNRNNQVVIELADDGGGINFKKVYQKAQSLGLLPPGKTFEQLSTEQILSFIFHPGFSTADQLTELSGRGLGLDIVKLELEKIRATIKVDTTPGFGTKFIITIPVSLNILSLLIFRSQKQLLAIPSQEVQSIIVLEEINNNQTLAQLKNSNCPPEPDLSHPETGFCHPEPDLSHPEPDLSHPEPDLSHPEPDLSHPEPDLSHPEPDLSHPETGFCHPEPDLSHPETGFCHPEHREGSHQTITWQNQQIPLFLLDQILPYHQTDVFLARDTLPKIALILKINHTYVAISVDQIVDERQLVVKPFDQLIPLPPYLAGCTILGSGQVVPILIPDYLNTLFKQQKAESNKQRTEEISILVIDDSIAVRRTLTQILTQSNYQVIQCRDGKEAWDLLNQGNQQFHLAISDLEMPRMDGFTLLQQIRNHPQWAKLPVVILTSRENNLHRQKATTLGANGYFNKPFNAVSFLEAIARLLP